MSTLGTFGMYTASGGGGGGSIPSEDMSYGVASGTDTYTVALSPAITSYTTGLLISVKFTNGNTSSTVTLNCNSLGAKSIKNRSGGSIFIGQIRSGGVYQLCYDGTNLILENDQFDGDICFFRKEGTTTLERWYTSATTVHATGTTALGSNFLRATPFVVPKTITLDRIGMEITGAGTAGSFVRLGIYSTTDNLPYGLVLDAGTIAGDSATFQSISINQTLTAGLYWLTYVHNSAASITFRTILVNTGVPSILGVTESLGSGNINANLISSTFTYGNLPDPFDYTGITASGLNIAIISVRLSV